MNFAFQDALPVEKWDGVYDAVNEYVKCPQRFGSKVVGQEDCLTLNVYTPYHSGGALPVMVFIHGGGFREGNNSPFLYGPEYFMDKGVILVAINYRLEVLGYLCLGIKEAPGNVGMKDQVVALQWIQRNIREFGGDPDNVTIFGESAGAASVAYHIISPMSRGLFHKAILQSGSAITPWSFQYDPLNTAIAFAKQMGHHTEDPHELYEIFINKTVQELLTARVPREEGNVILSETIFVPCVEKPIPGINAFLTDYPHDLLSRGQFNKVPIILGYNNAEGYMFAAKENATTIPRIDIFKSLPRDLKFPTNEEKEKVANIVKEFYLGHQEVSKETILNLSRFHGEPFFKYPMIATTDSLLKHNTCPLYNYRFARDGWLNVAKFFFGYGGHPGATHADDLFYMFKPLFPTPWLLETPVVQSLTTMWSNFAKYG